MQPEVVGVEAEPGREGGRNLFLDLRAVVLRYTEHYRAQVKEQIAATLAARLRLDPDDLRLHVLAELVMTAWSLSGRAWVRRGGKGGRPALLDGFADAISAVPASLSLAVPG